MADVVTAFARALCQEHFDELAFLLLQRQTLVNAPDQSLRTIGDLDEAALAHLDGIRVTQSDGAYRWEEALEIDDIGELAAAAVLTLESRDPARIDALLSLVESSPTLERGANAGFQWVDRVFLQGTVKTLLGSPSAMRRRIAIACCADHGVDPGLALDESIDADDVTLSARALKAAGQIGNARRRRACCERCDDPDEQGRFWAAWSAVLLGDRGRALSVLSDKVMSEGSFREPALEMLLYTMKKEEGHRLLTKVSETPSNTRVLIRGAGIHGDPSCVPWLIALMNDALTARLAADSFCLITGVDISRHSIQPQSPAPTDESDEDSADVAVADPDDGLLWPDSKSIEKWWDANRRDYTSGQRYFLGHPLSREVCKQALREGLQRQRRLAALYLALQDGAPPLFDTTSPAWRQHASLFEI